MSWTLAQIWTRISLPTAALLVRLFEHQTVALLWLNAGLQVVYLHPPRIGARHPAGSEASLPEVMRQSFESRHPCIFRELPLHATGREMMIDCAR